MKPIIDISYFNKVTDWEKVKEAVEGVIIRMGYTGYSSGKIVYDNKYKSYRDACEVLHIPHSFYYFPQSINEAEAKAEADFIIKELEDAGELFTPVWLDSEIAEVKNKSGRGDKLSAAQRTNLLRVIAQRVNDAGHKCGIYASTSWLNNNLYMAQLPFPVWCAQYATSCKYKGDYMLWQYSSTAKIPGISGNVDVSKWNEAYTEKSKISPELDAAITVLALNVISGYFGNGHDARKENIYKLVRDKVNELC